MGHRLTIRLWLLLAVASLVALGCSIENPCPRGTVQRGTRCLTPESSDGASTITDPAPDATSEAQAPADQGDLEPDSSPPDETDNADAYTPGLLDAAVARDGAPWPEGAIDAAGDNTAPDADADADAGADADTASPVVQECPDQDLDAWRRFQMSEQAVPTILACYAADPSCLSGLCDLASCLQTKAEVVGCDRCTTAETECVAKSCAVPCSVATNDDACRACACINRCAQPPTGCGFARVDACADCTGAACNARSASRSETITVPVSFVVLHDRVDPVTGLPAYAVSANPNETILDIDAQLVEVNRVLDAVRPDARRLRVIRAGVAYVPAPAAGVCPDPVALTDARRFYGGLNIVLTRDTPDCVAAATTAYAARASAATLLPVLGNLLGMQPSEQSGNPWQVTDTQFVRMHNYARWRLAESDAVPGAERATSVGFMHGPADPIWDKVTNRDWAFNNASVFDQTKTYSFSSLPFTDSFAVNPTDAVRRVLMVRVSARVAGVPSENLQVAVSLEKGAAPAVLPRSAIRIRDGLLVTEEAFDAAADSAWNKFKNHYGAATWTVQVDDTASLTLSELRLEIVFGDRAFVSYDRHARGVGDLMVYRAATSELLSAMNPANGTLAFGAVIREPVPVLPDPQAKVISGDVDGNGQVDLLARRGAAIWISFNKTTFTAWRPGSIAGTQLPSPADEVLMGDFDGDGFGDLMRRRPNIAIDRSVWGYYRGFGDGTFEPELIPTAEQWADINWTVADLDRKGRSDLIVNQNTPGMITVVYNTTSRPTTSGTPPAFFGAWFPRIGGEFPQFVASDRPLVLDANQDGNEDILLRRAGGDWYVFTNKGSEEFNAAQRLTVGGQVVPFAANDTMLGSVP
jgi:hypothetical protein